MGVGEGEREGGRDEGIGSEVFLFFVFISLHHGEYMGVPRAGHGILVHTGGFGEVEGCGGQIGGKQPFWGSFIAPTNMQHYGVVSFLFGRESGQGFFTLCVLSFSLLISMLFAFPGPFLSPLVIFFRREGG